MSAHNNKVLIALFAVLLIAVTTFLFFGKASAPVSTYEEQQILVLRDNEHYVSRVPEAEYTIVEYFDFDCVFCRRLHLELDNEPVDYSKVTYIVRSFPVTDISNSAYKSLIAECVYLQSGDIGYLTFMDEYFKEWGSKVQFDWVLALGRRLVVDEASFNECVTGSEELKNKISLQYSLDAVSGLYSTPTFVVYKNGILEEVYRNLGFRLYVSLVAYYSK